MIQLLTTYLYYIKVGILIFLMKTNGFSNRIIFIYKKKNTYKV